MEVSPPGFYFEYSTLLRRGSKEEKMKEKKKRKGKGTSARYHTLAFLKLGFPNLTRYQNEVQSHVLLIFLNKFSKLSQKYWHETGTQKQCKVSDLP